MATESKLGVLAGLCGGLLLLAGCAGALPSNGLETGSVGRFASDGRYQLSQAERDLDCRRLTGRMQVRILQVRDRMKTDRSFMTRALGTITDPFGNDPRPAVGSTEATRNDVAILNAYNQALAAKKCPTFDLAAELKAHDVRHTPRPVMPAKPL